MLRKRTVFKPNLSQVTGPKAPTPQQPPPPPLQPCDATNTNSATESSATGVGHNATNARPPSPNKAPQPVGAEKDASANSSDGPGVGVDQVDSGPPPDVSSAAAESATTTTTTAAATTTTETTISKSSEIDDESSKRVHEAITQLTGQRFEPIKSISLRNSANKNVKIKDLLFYNPPLTKDQKRHRKNLHLAKKNERKRLEEQNQSKAGDSNNKDKNDSNGNDNNTVEIDTDESSLVPKVKMGPDGKLILDESSTLINRKNSIKEKEAIIEDNEEIISRTNYDSYRRKPASTSQTKWSVDDTQKFYQALTIFGTDFSMMESLLFAGHRSRTELHKKFKREERINKKKIDIALSNRISLDSEELDELRDLFQRT
uniref:Transcription factor TFIIIB component B n=1 Tax=Aceria tosichella TaxID=561515 RepID=A0A6G1SB95_9ACAR